MTALLEKVRRSIRAFAQWLSIALEESGETQARIFHLVSATVIILRLRQADGPVKPIETTLIRIAVELDLFTILSDGGPKSVDKLAFETSAHPDLLARILRALAAVGAVRQTSPKYFAATKISKTFTDPSLKAGCKFYFDVVGKSWQCLPEFLKRTNYENPSNPRDCAINIAFKSQGSAFDILANRPEDLENFNSYMTVQRRDRANWLDFYPLDELAYGFSKAEDAVMLVDVGGGRGHEIQEINTRYPALPGRMILQDLQGTIGQVKPEPGMEVMAHDFFAPQAIRGARAYYFRNIFHDWPDGECREILRQAAAAMEWDYSRLLINEWCLPDQGSTAFATFSDINMMAACAGMERTKTQWLELLATSGFRVVKIWSATPDAESLIEAVLE